jgi:hypothetical protein
MRSLRQLMVLAALAAGAILALASLGDYNQDVPILDGNAALNGCYTQSGGSQLNSYWFDGVGRCSNEVWNSLTGSVSYGCTYQLSQALLTLTWDEDGSTKSFQVTSAENGIDLDGTRYEYAGASCS